MRRPLVSLLIAPLVGWEFSLKIAALVDLINPNRHVRFGNKIIWGLAIAFVNLFGLVPLAYFTFGREPTSGRARGA